MGNDNFCKFIISKQNYKKDEIPKVYFKKLINILLPFGIKYDNDKYNLFYNDDENIEEIENKNDDININILNSVRSKLLKNCRYYEELNTFAHHDIIEYNIYYNRKFDKDLNLIWHSNGYIDEYNDIEIEELFKLDNNNKKIYSPLYDAIDGNNIYDNINTYYNGHFYLIDGDEKSISLNINSYFKILKLLKINVCYK